VASPVAVTTVAPTEGAEALFASAPFGVSMTDDFDLSTSYAANALLALLFGDLPAFVERDDLECADADLSVFFLPQGGSTHRAFNMCARCPAKRECREWADDRGFEHGIFGGSTPVERHETKMGRSRT
jgi:WhiB family redox-sensing transcriptional regulator